jgi:hypothetical protein
MTIYKTTENIFTGKGEYFDENWWNLDYVYKPPTYEWDYSRKLEIEDVDLWEVICEPWEIGVYASYLPYAEFYLITHEKNHNEICFIDNPKRNFVFETFYGPGSQKKIKNFLKKNNIKVVTHKIWVPNEKMFLYQ